MIEEELTLGQALAITKKEIFKDTFEQKKLKSKTKSNLERFIARRDSFINSPEQVANILYAIPERCCDGEKSFLTDNENFFIAYLLECPANRNSTNHCTRLSKHLNDCIRCLEEYSTIMRDFYNQFNT